MLPGIKLIVTYCRFIGNSFFGWTYHGERISKWKIIFYKLWNVTIIIFLAVQFCYSYKTAMGLHNAFSFKNITNNHNNTTNKIDIFELLFLTSNTTFNLQGLLIAIYLFIFGKKIMTLLINQETIKIDPVWEHNLAKLIILVLIVYPILADILHTILTFSNNRKLIFMTLLPGVHLLSSNQILILSIITYKTMLIKKQLVNIFESNIEQIYKLVLSVDQSISDLDRYFSMPLPYNPVSSRSRLIPGRQDLLSEESISFNSRLV